MTNIIYAQVDISEAARRMGVKAPPAVYWGPTLSWSTAELNLLGGGNRWMYDTEIRLSPRLSDWHHLQIEANAQGRTPRWLENRDLLRWTVAHELGHALQTQRADNLNAYLREMRAQYKSRGPGVEHHMLPIEHEADMLARDVWRYVKVDGKMSRGTR